MLDFFDSLGIWAFRLNNIRMYFKDENEKSLQVALNRHIKNDIIQKCSRGVYINKRAKKPLFCLESLAGILRDNATFYLSLESLLSELGLISQFPNRLTFISQGRSGVFNTPYGIIEFVHSAIDAKEFLRDCFFDEKRKIYIASQNRAIKDIYKHNRSIDLYEEQLKKDKNGFA
ncbi:hypothetical protein K4G58_07205 [Helicobacter sp. Faydin-H64]|uniref:Uncharacterized protein n=2 Tax=Helicobacter turcicus TaxID=2867412 RepID=A0ABS7JPF7_9HELI|nr:hypothetical protein [Helicobacter turcicus]MBX7491254.1 hypothetical protein [Helicobacter turcicus]MBX7546107.1 hypothetical protein [Helicobacter turcicus]